MMFKSFDRGGSFTVLDDTGSMIDLNLLVLWVEANLDGDVELVEPE